MRHRLVDFVVIAGLVAVAGGIMWTLFNLGGSQHTLSPPTDGCDSQIAIVADAMNPHFCHNAYVYVGTNEDACAYGLTPGSITPLK